MALAAGKNKRKRLLPGEEFSGLFALSRKKSLGAGSLLVDYQELRRGPLQNGGRKKKKVDSIYFLKGQR